MNDDYLAERIQRIRDIVSRKGSCGCGEIDCVDNFTTPEFGEVVEASLREIEQHRTDPLEAAKSLLDEADVNNVTALITGDPIALLRALTDYRLALITYDIGKLRT